MRAGSAAFMCAYARARKRARYSALEHAPLVGSLEVPEQVKHEQRAGRHVVAVPNLRTRTRNEIFSVRLSAKRARNVLVDVGRAA